MATEGTEFRTEEEAALLDTDSGATERLQSVDGVVTQEVDADYESDQVLALMGISLESIGDVTEVDKTVAHMLINAAA
jgi:hypothetical protein